MNPVLRKPTHPKAMKQKFIVTLLSASMTTFLLGGAVVYWVLGTLHPVATTETGDSPGKAKPRGPQAQLVRVGTIDRQKIVPVKTLVGDLVAVRNATIAAEVAGKVIALPVDEGSRVIKDETLLARIDDTWLRLEEDKIVTQIAEKKASLSFEKSDLQRFEKLFQNNAMSASELEQKRSLIEGLEASLANLKVLLDEAAKRNERLEVFAPFDGSVVAKSAEVGEYLNVGSPIVEIVSSGRIDARIMVPERSLSLLKQGDTIEVVIDSLAMELTGTVFAINSQGSVGSRTFPVRVELDDRDGLLRPGMGVSAFVPVKHELTELVVPRDAVLMEPDESTIWILQPKKDSVDPNALFAYPVPVRVLSHTRQAYAISCSRKVDQDRVHAGVQVVTEGLERLVPGALVRVDADRSPLASVPGTYRTGQQIAE